MRVAVTKATLQIPPTYFAVQHAIALRDRYEFRFFASAAHVSDALVRAALPLTDVSAGLPAIGSFPFSTRRRLAPLLDQPAARAISRWKPDLIHQHFANLSGAAVRAGRTIPAPMLLTVHGADIHLLFTDVSELRGRARALHGLHRRTIHRALGEATSVLAVSEFLASRVVAAGVPAQRVRVHYQGVDTDVYAPAHAAARDDGPPRVVFVGALSEAKGIPDLLQASTELMASTPHRLTLVGDGPLRPLAEAAAASHPFIEVLGSLPRDRVRDVLGSSTVLVLPTKHWRGWREAAGLVSLEAQAMGVPVVVYDSGGAGEMLRDRETGILVDEGDVAALADAIRGVVDLPARERTAMGERARRFVVAERSLAASVEQLAVHYEEAVR